MVLTSKKGSHLTAEKRTAIQSGIADGRKKKDIAKEISVSPSTVGKEIRLHRYAKYTCRLPLECAAYRTCAHGRECTPECPDFEQFVCLRRDRSPGACNGCSSYRSCRFTKYWYDAARAHAEYRADLTDSREGVNLTTSQAMSIGAKIRDGLDRGLSPYAILQENPDLGISEKTIYNYIDQNVFALVGIANISLRRKVSRKMPRKTAVKYKARKSSAYLAGRTHDDFLRFLEEHPDAKILQMDTVYNDITAGPFIQTFKFIGISVILAVYHDTKTAADMNSGLDFIEAVIGREVFDRCVDAVLTDRGSEFSDADRLEHRADGSFRKPVFYCDPMRAGQKGSLENSHELIRYVVPKKTDMRAAGLVSQEALDEIISNINSYPLRQHRGKCAFEQAEFYEPDLMKSLQKYGYRIIREQVTLTPELIRRFREGAEKSGG